MSVDVTITGPRFGDLTLIDRAMMTDVGDLATTRIRRRTQKGLSVAGGAFTPLSRRYARQKQKAFGHSRADLTASGRMLNDMGPTDVQANAVTIAFRSSGAGSRRGTFIQRSRSMGANDKAFYHQEGGRVLRPFFDLSPEDEAAIVDALDQAIDARISK